MDLRGDDFKRSARAPAKLNLFLDVLGRRRDGFHELQTLMVPIRLADQIAFTPCFSAADDSSNAIRLEVRTCWPGRAPPTQVEVPAGPDNLVVKSLELLRERSGCPFGAHVELIKRIPMGAGLGGGSSDAAAALRLANRGWKLNWTTDRLIDFSAELGSDIPFFLSQGAAICRGRGERIERLPPLPLIHFVFVKPAASLNSGAVYSAHDSLVESGPQAADGQLNRLVANLYKRCWRDIGRWMHNRLQAAAGVLSPGVEKLRQVFNELDVVGHQLTGSGSAYFGVCRHAPHARHLANILRTRQLGTVYTTCSCQ